MTVDMLLVLLVLVHDMVLTVLVLVHLLRPHGIIAFLLGRVLVLLLELVFRGRFPRVFQVLLI